MGDSLGKVFWHLLQFQDALLVTEDRKEFKLKDSVEWVRAIAYQSNKLVEILVGSRENT